jgi:hypothetical protein
VVLVFTEQIKPFSLTAYFKIKLQKKQEKIKFVVRFYAVAGRQKPIFVTFSLILRIL